MKKFKVKFEVLGKNYQTEVKALSQLARDVHVSS